MNAFVAAARSLIGTPYHTKGRLPGVGLDCIGVPIVAAWLCGLRPRSFDIRGYSDVPDGSLLPLCDQHMQRVARVAIPASLRALAHELGAVEDKLEPSGHRLRRSKQPRRLPRQKHRIVPRDRDALLF